MWWLLWLLTILLALFCFLDVWYFLRVVVVVARAWFQPPVRDITAEQVLTGRVTPRDIDMCHMNNARYLRECDFARFSLYTRNGILKAARALRGSLTVGATTIRYRRALCIGESFELRSRIVTWDEKAFYLEQRFVSTMDGLVCAVMYCKQNVVGSAPAQLMQHLCKRKALSRAAKMIGHKTLQQIDKLNTQNSARPTDWPAQVECPEFPVDLQHWVSFITASSQALRAESGLQDKDK